MAELWKRGVFAVVICSTPFMKLGSAQARTFGAPDLPLIEIPHPLGGLTLDRVRERAAVTLPKLVQLIRERAR